MFRKTFIPVLTICAAILSGCGGGVSHQLSEATKSWVQPAKPTQPEADIPSVGSDFQCAGTWACQGQFTTIVRNKTAKGILTDDHNRVIIAELRGDIFSMSGLSMEHAYFTGAIVEKHGNGTPVDYVMRTRRNPTHNFYTVVPIGPFPVIINHSMKSMWGRPRLSGLNAIFVQITGNENSREPPLCRYSGCRSDLAHMASAGRLIMVGTWPHHRRSRCGSYKTHCLVAAARGVSFDFEGEQRYTSTSGTSWAAPQVSAALQLLSTMWPYLAQEELVELLLGLAEDKGEPGVDPIWGRGQLSFEKLFTSEGFRGFKCNETDCVDKNAYS